MTFGFGFAVVLQGSRVRAWGLYFGIFRASGLEAWHGPGGRWGFEVACSCIFTLTIRISMVRFSNDFVAILNINTASFIVGM